MFMTMLSLTFWLNAVTTSWGTACLSCSAIVFEASLGNATSTCRVWSAAVRVPRSAMTR